MMVKPCAKAIAAMPGRPTPSPTTTAAPAPMNTNAKVPMNSARSLGARELDVVEFDVADLQKRACVTDLQRRACVGLVGATGVAPENHAWALGGRRHAGRPRARRRRR